MASKFKVGQKVKTLNAESGVIISKSNISDAWNVEINRKFGKEIEKVVEYYFEDELTIK